MTARKPYEKPTIVRHRAGTMNKFGGMQSGMPFSKIDGVPVRDLAARYGSPLYVFSEGGLRRAYRDLQKAFALRYPKVQIAYSYKTNYLAALCALFHQEGAWAEVVSGFEYELALALNVPERQIIFNGPNKTEAELARAAAGGARIHADSYEEIEALERLAASTGKTIPIGLRVNMQLPTPLWDRFGFNLESGQAFDAARRAVAGGRLALTSLHTHIGTFVTETAAYRKAVEKLADFAAQLSEELKITLDAIDLGGGFASHATLHTQWLPPDDVVPSPDEYAEAICPPLLSGPFKPNAMPLLILEPGRALVDEAGYLIASVVSSKRLPATQQKAVVLDAGVNLLPTSYWYRLDVSPAEPRGVTLESVSLYGPLCMQIDCLRQNVSLPPLRRGDLVVFKGIGAYNLSQSMQFIQPRPAAVLVGDGTVEVIRRPEDTAHLRSLDEVPARFAGEQPARATVSPLRRPESR